jgi:Skp family chaperone for outer membrane proteins
MRTRLFILAVVIAAACSTLNAQPAPASAATKVAIIDTEMFGDPKGGIKRITVAFEQISREFKPRMDELQALRAKYDALIKSASDTRSVAAPETIRQKYDEAETLNNDIKRKQEDGQKALDKRTKDLTGPIYDDIGKALQAYAKQRGIDVVLDVSKLAAAMMVINEAVDITAAFTAEYNAKSTALPAGVPVKTP